MFWYRYQVVMLKSPEVSVVVPREYHLNSKKRQLVPAAVLGVVVEEKGTN